MFTNINGALPPQVRTHPSVECLMWFDDRVLPERESDRRRGPPAHPRLDQEVKTTVAERPLMQSRRKIKPRTLLVRLPIRLHHRVHVKKVVRVYLFILGPRPRPVLAPFLVGQELFVAVKLKHHHVSPAGFIRVSAHFLEIASRLTLETSRRGAPARKQTSGE